jgi:hypothetical protein
MVDGNRSIAKRARRSTRIVLASALGLVLTLAGCSRGQQPAAPAPKPGSAPAAAPPGTAAPWSGSVLHGGDPASLRRFLDTVREIQPSTFRVEWNPATVAFDRDAARRALRRVSRDGRRFTLDATEPAVAKLKSGSILWIWDVTVSKVERVEQRDGLAVVYTRPVPLNEALPNAEISFAAAVPVGNFLLNRKLPPAAARTALLRRHRSPFIRASLVNDGAPPAGGDPQDTQDDQQSDADQQAFQGNSFKGSLKGYDYTVGYAPGADGSLKILLEANDTADADGGLDVRFKMLLDMQGFSAGGSYLFQNGNVEKAQLEFKSLTGHATVSFVGRLGETGTKGTKIPLMDVPVSFTVPMPIGGIPFMLQIGADFNINVFLAGQHAALSLDGEYSFRGDSGFTYSKTTANYTSTFASDQPTITGHQGWSPGASAVVLGIQLPRLGYGVGLFGVSSMAYFDVVHVLTMTNAPNVAIGLMPPCKRVTYAAVGHVGIDTELLPIPVAAVQNAANKLSPKKEVFKVEKELLDPPIKGCGIGS